MRHRITRYLCQLAPLALLLLFTGCASGNGPFSALSMIQMDPDIEAVLACPSVACGVDARCAIGFEFDDVKTAYREETPLAKPITIQAAGPLADKLQAGGSLGRLITANGRFTDGVFAARELTLKKDALSTDVAGAVLKAVAAGLCDQKPASKSAPVASLVAPACPPAPECPSADVGLEECRAVVGRAQYALSSVLDTNECRTPDTIAAEARAFDYLHGNGGGS